MRQNAGKFTESTICKIKKMVEKKNENTRGRSFSIFAHEVASKRRSVIERKRAEYIAIAVEKAQRGLRYI